MMNAPNCPTHADLARDLALGRLDDGEGLRAEEALTTCTCCQAWWDETFSSAELERLDAAVSDVLTDLVLPSRQRRQPWLAVAAAAVIAFASSFLWLQHQSPDTSHQAGLTPVQVDQPAGEALLPAETMDFESGNMVVGQTAPPTAHLETEPLVAAGFESGAVEAESPDRGTTVLTAMSFESGSFDGLVPTT